MGFDLATVHFLARAKDAGVSFNRVLTLGRQWLYLKPEELASQLRRDRIEVGDTGTARLFSEAGGYCEPLLKLFGAGCVDSMDVSDYEHATLMQDLNLPWPPSLQNKFSLLIDAGTLEHVFNFPLALQNCMQAIAVGGHFLSVTPANNLMGHGFYQFSPELFFRVFAPENGFQIEKVLIYEQPWNSVWYEVADPQAIRSRVELVNRKSAYLIVLARKVAAVPLFQRPPLQSDYPLLYWQQTAGEGTAGTLPIGSPNAGLARYAPGWAAEIYRRIRPFRPRYFTRAD